MFQILLFSLSALIGSGVLFHHKRSLTYIALAGVLFEAQMLLTTFLHRTIGQSISGPDFFFMAGIVCTTFWLACYKSWKSPYSVSGSGKRDIYVGIALLLVLAGAYPIVSANGFIGKDFVMHGFYNGDVATFASLVQKSFNTSELVSKNPFSGNGSLEYPTLLHGTFADFFSLLSIGKDWLYYLAVITYAQIFLTIPMFFLLWDTVYPEPKNPAEKWFGLSSRAQAYSLQLLLTLVAIALSVDSFVYPQSHFFLIALFIGCAALCTKASTLQGKGQLLPLGTAFVFALLLIQANTVTGTVAMALAGILCFVRIFDKKRPIPERALFLLIGILLLIAMKYASTGRTALNSPHFSISSASDMIRAGMPALFILGASLYSLSKKQYIAIAAGAAAFLGFLVFFLSDRNIVTENASRFLYHSFVIGFVLLLPLVIQLLYWVRRELLLTSRPISEYIGGWILAGCAALILLLPIGVSVGNTYVNLLRNDKHVISQNTRFALEWIDDHAAADAVVITNPNEPFAIPLFTGRAMLRATDYWLSAHDDVATKLEKAFMGDSAAQKEILPLGSFLFISKDDAKMWNTTKLKKVADTGDIIVYATH